MFWLFLAIGLSLQQSETHVFPAASPNPILAHNSANEFEQHVQNAFQNNYPSRLADVHLNFKIVNVNGRPLYELRWSYTLQRCKPQEADFHFSRRGTLLWADSKEAAIKAVQQQLQSSGKIQQMIDGFRHKYGSYRMPKAFVSKPDPVKDPISGKWWYIEEYFITAPKS